MRAIHHCPICNQPCISTYGLKLHVSKTHQGINRIRNQHIMQDFMGEVRTVRELMEVYALTRTSIYNIIRRGLTYHSAFLPPKDTLDEHADVQNHRRPLKALA